MAVTREGLLAQMNGKRITAINSSGATEWKTIRNSEDVQKLLDSGYTFDANTTNWLSGNLGMSNFDTTENRDMNTGIKNAQDKASQIMEGIRPYGQDNPYLNREYGVDNPYMKSALGNIKELETISKSGLPTEYAQAMLDQQDLLGKMQKEDLTKGFSSDLASSYSNLAQGGGLDSGARERLYTSGNNNMMMGRQRIGAETASSRLGILGQDATYKQNLRTSIPGMYNPYAQGIESLNQSKATGMENYNQALENQRLATIGNIYAGTGGNN